jgi:hypothetical protein
MTELPASWQDPDRQCTLSKQNNNKTHPDSMVSAHEHKLHFKIQALIVTHNLFNDYTIMKTSYHVRVVTLHNDVYYLADAKHLDFLLNVPTVVCVGYLPCINHQVIYWQNEIR